MSGTGPLAPPRKLLNIPLSVLHQEDATWGVVSRGERSKERQGGSGPGEVQGGRRPGEEPVLGGSTKAETWVSRGGRGGPRGLWVTLLFTGNQTESQRDAPFEAELVTSADETTV